MKRRIGLNLDESVIDAVDGVRGMIPRSRFVGEALTQKVEQIRREGGVIGQI